MSYIDIDIDEAVNDVSDGFIKLWFWVNPLKPIRKVQQGQPLKTLTLLGNPSKNPLSKWHRPSSQHNNCLTEFPEPFFTDSYNNHYWNTAIVYLGVYASPNFRMSDKSLCNSTFSRTVYGVILLQLFGMIIGKLKGILVLLACVARNSNEDHHGLVCRKGDHKDKPFLGFYLCTLMPSSANTVFSYYPPEVIRIRVPVFVSFYFFQV